MKMKNAETGNDKGRMAGRAASAVLAGALLGSCVPDVNIKNIPYDPTAPDAGCSSVSSCAKQSATLRPSGSSAGSSETAIGGAKLSLIELKDSNGTKAVNLKLESCGITASNDFLPGASAMLTAGKDDFLVTVVSVSYDGAGLKVDVSVQPVCAGDGGAAKEAGKSG